MLNSKNKFVWAMDKVSQNINRWGKGKQQWFDKIQLFKDVLNLKDQVIKEDKKAIEFITILPATTFGSIKSSFIYLTIPTIGALGENFQRYFWNFDLNHQVKYLIIRVFW